MPRILSLVLALGAASNVILSSGCSKEERIKDRPESYLAMRYEATVPQQKEFTCGAASIATLLTFYWHTPMTEDRVLKTLKGRYTDKQISHISETGLSFDDLIYMAQHLGFSAEGAKIAIDQLPNLAGPVIVNLKKGSLKHFVVLRKVVNNVYYTSDPVVGELSMSASEFKEQFTGYIMAIWKQDANLPNYTILTNPRDGIRVSDSLRRVINVEQTPFSPGF